MEYVRLAARTAARVAIWGTFTVLAVRVAAQIVAGAALVICHLTGALPPA